MVNYVIILPLMGTMPNKNPGRPHNHPGHIGLWKFPIQLICSKFGLALYKNDKNVFFTPYPMGLKAYCHPVLEGILVLPKGHRLKTANPFGLMSKHLQLKLLRGHR